MASAPPTSDTILFISSNGAGLGHLTRILAVVRRMPLSVRSVLATMSTAVQLGRDQGCIVEHIPRPTDWDSTLWHEYLEERLLEVFHTYQPIAVVFDGAVPYAGLVNAIQKTSAIRCVWIKRGLWRRKRRRFARRSRFFDLVIEPGEAALMHAGPSTERRGRTVVVPPMLLLDDSELLTRDEARSRLELHPTRTSVLLNLGAGNINDTSTPVGAILSALAEQEGINVVMAESIISEQSLELPPHVRRLRQYPISQLLRAFDVVVSATGYNSFHEVLRAGIPAIFIPMHTNTDNQDVRATYAETIGAARCLRPLDRRSIEAAFGDLLDADKRGAFTGAGQGIFQRNGAEVAAHAIMDLIRGNDPSHQRASPGAAESLWRHVGGPVLKILRRGYGRWQRMRGRSPAVPGGGTVGGPMSIKELGTVTMFDARGVGAEELMPCVEKINAMLETRFGVRPLFVVDTDDLPLLRRLGVLYEYIPPAHASFDHDYPQFVEARIESLRKTFRPDRVIVLDPARPLEGMRELLQDKPAG